MWYVRTRPQMMSCDAKIEISWHTLHVIILCLTIVKTTVMPMIWAMTQATSTCTCICKILVAPKNVD